ncbi:hypothetical protein TCA2_5676 [Paenibacillus sp. TCA20]|nr:hypothetical protein TCA2_5676 [Paenibacillus sp. TCA20]
MDVSIKLREFTKKILLNDIVNMAHLGPRAFDAIGGEIVQTTAFVIRPRQISRYRSEYIRLVDVVGENEKKDAFLSGNRKYTAPKEYFYQIPGIPIAYWITKKAVLAFGSYEKIKEILLPKQGTSTGNDEKFVRYWHEINASLFSNAMTSIEEAINSGYKYFPLDKGGEYRKWFGNNEKVIKMDRKSYDELLLLGNHLPSRQYYFREGLTWSKIASELSVRYDPQGFVFSSVGLKGFPDKRNIYAVLSYMNSKVCRYFTNIISPGLSIISGDIEKLPYSIIESNEIDQLTKENISLSKKEWDAYEVSWDFVRHPFLGVHIGSSRLEQIFIAWDDFIAELILKLKGNEEELNRIFIKIYGLQDELSPEVEEKDVTIRKADLGRDVRSFLSYAVGCMFGRYSLNFEGLAYAGGDWDDSKYTTFIPDKDNVIPITDEEYFEDDIVGLFCAFLKKSFGSDTLEENLDFIAKALGNKGNTSREVIRNYFLKDFFKDHCKVYQKRPIYWLYDSGKEDGFKALIYMHRYNEDTIGNLRIDYLHRMQRVYESEITRMQETIDNSNNAREVAAATKRKEKLIRQLKETKEYDEKIAHLALARIPIDLDDGLKVNYDKVQTGTDGKKLDVLAKI